MWQQEKIKIKWTGLVAGQTLPILENGTTLMNLPFFLVRFMFILSIVYRRVCVAFQHREGTGNSP